VSSYIKGLGISNQCSFVGFLAWHKPRDVRVNLLLYHGIKGFFKKNLIAYKYHNWGFIALITIDFKHIKKGGHTYMSEENNKEEFLSDAEEEHIAHLDANRKNLKWIVGLVVLIILVSVATIMNCDLPQKMHEQNNTTAKVKNTITPSPSKQ